MGGAQAAPAAAPARPDRAGVEGAPPAFAPCRLEAERPVADAEPDDDRLGAAVGAILLGRSTAAIPARAKSPGRRASSANPHPRGRRHADLA